MRQTILALVLLLPMTTWAQSPATSTPAQAAAAVYEAFFEAMTHADMDRVVAMFTADALFWGTTTRTLATDLTGIDAYFSPLRGNQPGQNVFRPVDHSVVALDGDTLLLSGRWEAGPGSGTTFTPMRVSMVLVHRDGTWKIAQFHNSMAPQ